jgi:hypothetical protein
VRVAERPADQPPGQAFVEWPAFAHVAACSRSSASTIFCRLIIDYK